MISNEKGRTISIALSDSQRINLKFVERYKQSTFRIERQRRDRAIDDWITMSYFECAANRAPAIGQAIAQLLSYPEAQR